MKKITVYPAAVSALGRAEPEVVFFSNREAQKELAKRDHTEKLPVRHFSREDARQVPIFDTVKQYEDLMSQMR